MRVPRTENIQSIFRWDVYTRGGPRKMTEGRWGPEISLKKKKKEEKITGAVVREREKTDPLVSVQL